MEKMYETKSNMYLVKDCPICRRANKIRLTKKQGFRIWFNSAFNPTPIQDIIPHHSDVEREFCKTGICPDCQAELFGSEARSTKIKLA